MVDIKVTELHVPGELTKNGEDFTLPLVYRDGKPMFDFVTDLKKSARQGHEPVFDTTDFRSQWRQACAKLGYGIFNPETHVYRGLRPHDFRRTACRNMIKAGIPQAVRWQSAVTKQILCSAATPSWIRAPFRKHFKYCRRDDKLNS